MWAILAKDWRIELRSREGISSLLVLALLIVLIFQFALPGDPTPRTASAALWLGVLLAGMLGIQRTVLRERESLAIDGLLSAPVEPGTIFLAKVIGNVLVLAALQAMLVPIIVVLFRVSLDLPGTAALALVLLLGNMGFAALATLFAAITVQTRAGEVLLPLMIFPLMVPILLAGTSASADLFGGAGLADVRTWIEVLGASGVVFVVLGWLLFETVVRE